MVRKCSPVSEMDCKCPESVTAVREPKWLSMVRNIYYIAKIAKYFAFFVKSYNKQYP